MNSYISQSFTIWVDGLPAEGLIAAIILGCIVWALSIFRVAGRRLARGAK